MLVIVIAASAGACGFHLRGVGGSAVLPPSLSTVRLEMPSGLGVNEPIAVMVADALRRAGAEVTESETVPVLRLYSERVDSQVASVRASTGKASEYTLHYSVNFVVDNIKPARDAETVRLQREYTFDPTRVVSKEYEERQLIEDMRREAAQQIVFRISRRTASR